MTAARPAEPTQDGDRVVPPPQGHDTDPAFALHEGGKMEIAATVEIRDATDLALAYTPGVARVCQAIADEPAHASTYTWVDNTVAVVTDGSAVLGLGNIGPRAAMPVMEGKAILFKQFAGVDAIPICLDSSGVDAIVDVVAAMAPSFGGINLEDISAPRCFEIEERLQARLDIPVFHDDQHGTAIVTLAALRNALELTSRDIIDTRIVIAGAGAAGVAVARILLSAGARSLAVVDSKGVLSTDRDDLSAVKRALAQDTEHWSVRGSLGDAMSGAEVFIGVSGGSVGADIVATMASDAIVFAMANPTPEVDLSVAHRQAAVVATGRSDHPNQINNVLAFPGVFRGALDVRARRITEKMKVAAADALASLVAGGLSVDYVLPSPFDARVTPTVASAVAAAAREDGVARR